MIELKEIGSIEIEGLRVVVLNKQGQSMASSSYDSNERAMEVANDIWNKKVKLYHQGKLNG